ncbi:unnamed protein product [Rhizophagus irregularis]|uniref:Uncharacterized protein n=1 Tax=Rhizophagus irregularis TaxID=588596 RepID=A0A2N1NG00_9GLOM|nr:hypothetical protein RhiirC2_776770 [Rhizophagus irregularis]CAB4381932.1 unnamed protein product [Rhizophagus irregularis]CAB5352766.1 unnamed protein product [Rhizophagus irregularis]
MVEDTLETLSEKLKIYQKFFESLVPSAVPSNTLTSYLAPLTEGSLTSAPTSSLTPLMERSLTPAPTPSKIIYKPNKRYIKVEEILELTNLKKNEYNNLLSEVRFIMANLHIDFDVLYKNQNINLISKIIKRFTKRNPNAPIGEGSWVVKEKEITKKKEKEKENTELFEFQQHQVQQHQRQHQQNQKIIHKKRNENEDESENINEKENVEHFEYQHHCQQQLQIQNDNYNDIDINKQRSNDPFHLILPPDIKSSNNRSSRFRKQYLVYENDEHEINNGKAIDELNNEKEIELEKSRVKRNRKLINYKE